MATSVMASVGLSKLHSEHEAGWGKERGYC